MANLFDRANYPTQEPDTLVVGDRWMWRRPDLASIYDPSEYALTYEYHRDSGGGGVNKFTITATETSDDYIIEVPSSTTDAYVSNAYIWYAFITRSSDSERIAVDNGRAELVDDFADSNADVRSHAKTVLDAIEAVYSIAGRSLSRMSIDDLMTFRNRYRAEYLEEIKKSRIKNKQDSGNLVKVRF
jgi:hypothetical protein